MDDKKNHPHIKSFIKELKKLKQSELKKIFWSIQELNITINIMNLIIQYTI